ncbi:MAG TPA: adenine phosphoribosyltransferase [Frankiaceae bacterium]|nr:adenine phosphoribosyltransferase [Frankiaceae bacterium]
MTFGSTAGDVLRSHIRDVADFPKPGVMFKDINPLLADPVAFGTVVNALAEHARSLSVNKIAGIEARGFFFAAPVALAVGVGVLPIRKAGKLPGPTLYETYALEYGSATVEIQKGVVEAGDRVLVIDDVLATGGTAVAAAGLLRAAGADPVALSVLLELTFLHGRDRVSPLPVSALLPV